MLGFWKVKKSGLHRKKKPTPELTRTPVQNWIENHPKPPEQDERAFAEKCKTMIHDQMSQRQDLKELEARLLANIDRLCNG